MQGLLRAQCSLLMLALLANSALAYEPAIDNKPITAQAIVNGTLAVAGAQPWMAALLRKNSTNTAASQRKFCGGTLVASAWVMTAAHCVESAKAAAIEIVLGRDDLDGSGGAVHQVSRILVHPRYNDETNFADIALLQLSTVATATPVALPTAVDPASFLGSTGITLGWGSTRGQNKLPCTLRFLASPPSNAADYSCKTLLLRSLTQSTLLRSAPATVLTNTACNSRFIAFLREHKITVPAGLTNAVELYPHTLCAIDPSQGASACYGDSGGPLIMQRNGKPMVIGITAFGLELSCQGPNHIEFYTEVAAFFDFITTAMASSAALTFDALCAAPVGDIAVSVGQVVNGSASVKLSWQPAARAIGYRVLFVELPRRDNGVGRREAVRATELQATLQSPSRYLVAVQGQGSACDAVRSQPVEVVVP